MSLKNRTDINRGDFLNTSWCDFIREGYAKEQKMREAFEKRVKDGDTSTLKPDTSTPWYRRGDARTPTPQNFGLGEGKAAEPPWGTMKQLGGQGKNNRKKPSRFDLKTQKRPYAMDDADESRWIRMPRPEATLDVQQWKASRTSKEKQLALRMKFTNSSEVSQCISPRPATSSRARRLTSSRQLPRQVGAEFKKVRKRLDYLVGLDAYKQRRKLLDAFFQYDPHGTGCIGAFKDLQGAISYLGLNCNVRPLQDHYKKHAQNRSSGIVVYEEIVEDYIKFRANCEKSNR